MNSHCDFRTKTLKGLINRVIDKFLHHMVQSSAIIGISDIHTRSFFDSL